MSTIGASIWRRNQKKDADRQSQVERHYQLIDSNANREEQCGAEKKSEETSRAADVRRAAARALFRMPDGVLRGGGGLLRGIEAGDSVEDSIGAIEILGGHLQLDVLIAEESGDALVFEDCFGELRVVRGAECGQGYQRHAARIVGGYHPRRVATLRTIHR